MGCRAVLGEPICAVVQLEVVRCVNFQSFTRYCQIAFQSVNVPSAHKDSHFPTCSYLALKCFYFYLAGFKMICYNCFDLHISTCLLAIQVSSESSLFISFAHFSFLL